MNKPQNLSEALNADKVYTQAGEERSALVQQIHSIQGEQKSKFWEIQALLRAADLCDSKRNHIEGEDDEVLVRNTGECSDCWDTNWFASTQAIFASVEVICREIADMTKSKKALIEKKDQMSERINGALERVRKEFHAMQES
tara:strand:+ start:365 stop:790 length:426 start_codon:yes stop_codon:yes gene_type:complete